MVAAAVTSTRPIPIPLAATITTGTAEMASRSNTTGIALGRAKFAVHPLHFGCFGTITRGSALQ
jgi:hypothetical protein